MKKERYLNGDLIIWERYNNDDDITNAHLYGGVNDIIDINGNDPKLDNFSKRVMKKIKKILNECNCIGVLADIRENNEFVDVIFTNSQANKPYSQ